MPDHPGGLTALLVGFARELRAAGISVGTGDALTYVEALATLNPVEGAAADGLSGATEERGSGARAVPTRGHPGPRAAPKAPGSGASGGTGGRPPGEQSGGSPPRAGINLLDLYWAGRATLARRREDIPVYDRVFRAYFLAEESPADAPLRLSPQAKSEAEAVLAMTGTKPGPEEDTQEQRLGLMASNVQALKHRSFAACTPEELAALRRIMRTIRLTPPRRRTRRMSPAPTGTVPDIRRTIRNETRFLAPPSPLEFRRRKTKLRPLILILDISGSMADYSRTLLQFAHTARHAAAKVEVFVFGTRLSRITRQLQTRRVDVALRDAGRDVRDWEGGTRIGESLATFLRRWGRGGMCRGSVVVICSDGLDRGDPELLAASMEKLARLAYRVVWLNPHKGDNRDFVPSTVGMMVAAPHVDLLLSGHDLASLEDLAARLPVLR